MGSTFFFTFKLEELDEIVEIQVGEVQEDVVVGVVRDFFAEESVVRALV